jgi:hypothetical protein
LIGPWPEPAGGSCQSETFDCQPNVAEANGGTALFSSSAALGSASATIKPATALPASIDDRSADAVSMERIIVFIPKLSENRCGYSRAVFQVAQGSWIKLAHGRRRH